MLLGPSNIFTRVRWFKRCRVWRLVLLMDSKGFWDTTPGLAMALLAQRVRPKDVAHLRRRKREGKNSLFLFAVTDGDLNEAGDDVEGELKETEARLGGGGGRCLAGAPSLLRCLRVLNTLPARVLFRSHRTSSARSRASTRPRSSGACRSASAG